VTKFQATNRNFSDSTAALASNNMQLSRNLTCIVILRVV
jgi:hypothetical protein